MKALALLSGGLDSSLAVKFMLDQDIEVIGVNFFTPFCLCDGKKGRKKKSIVLAEELNIELKLFNISEEYLQIVKNPRYGYGKNLNSCIDCRILMLRKAKQLMSKIGADFVITGEVLGQRPMSQNRRAMEIIEKESGLEGLIVRPLSAKLLPPTIPEKEGWINRERLLDIVGRTRKRQFSLAKEFGISEYACPAGGCLLTDPIFSARIRDLLNSDMLTLQNINLVKSGRYFRISDSFKLIVGRNQEENQRLMKLTREGDLILELESKGPVAVGRGRRESEDIETASRIVAYYCKDEKGRIKVRSIPEEEVQVVTPVKMTDEELFRYKLPVKEIKR
ncbi:MAG TPA: hypothetical protein EYP78_07215 [Candidatus Omnitrophica bacterium]|nr:hypothetical protein [Candidatus Omnitrophota bacterium]